MAKAGDIAVLDRNLDFQNLGISPKDMGFVFGRRYTREQIASAFGVPIQVVSGEITGRSTLDVAREQLLTDAIIPMLTLNMETINEHLLPKLNYDDDTLFYWYENPITDDKEIEQKVLSGYVESAIMTSDEARARLMLEPLGIDYLMYHGVPIGAEKQAKAVVDAIDKAIKEKKIVNL